MPVQSITVDITPIAPTKGVLPKLNQHIYNYINFASPVFRRLKERRLERYVNKYLTAPAQGTVAWLESRKKTIGGSEIATVLGQNNYCTYANWMAEKVGITDKQFDGNTATRFGKLFENVGSRFIETIFDTKIYNVGGIEGSFTGIKYSPDGLALIKYACFDTIAGKPVSTVEYLITLLEFKSPLVTIPNGNIPKHYVPQIMTGLATLEVETGLFVNNMYRKCSLEQFKPNLLYDTKFHHKDTPDTLKEISGPCAMGIIYFYCKDDKYDDVLDILVPELVQDHQSISLYVNNDKTKLNMANMTQDELDCIVELNSTQDQDNDDVLDDSYHVCHVMTDDCVTSGVWTCEQGVGGDGPFKKGVTLIDFGNRNSRFDSLLNLYADTNKVIAIIDDPYIDRKKIEALPLLAVQKEMMLEKNQWIPLTNYKSMSKHLPKEYSHVCEIAETHIPGNDYTCIGFLPWKLLISDIISVERDIDYLSTHAEKINATVSILNQLNQLSSRELKQAKFNELFH